MIKRTSHATRIVAVLIAAIVLASCGGGYTAPSPNPTPTSSGPPPMLALSLVVSGLTSPLDLESPDDGSGRLFVVEQGGRIKIIQNGAVLSQPFLDISSKITTGGEMGLLGVTFHPNFSTNPKFYVNYVRTQAGQIQSVISEYSLASASSNQADASTERILLPVNQVGNFNNHKAGQLAFGADGFLYFGLGDGGSGGDPNGNAQSKQTLLGKMMRIDIDGTSSGLQYRIPSDNPFVSGGGMPEIYAYGFRNPWRFSFDRPTNRLFVADVGQGSFEEVDIVQKGGNYGWNTMEGNHCFNPATGCNMSSLSLPIAEYDHSVGIAVIGGYVYHGTSIATLQGTYVFGDLNGKIFGLQETSPNNWTRTLLATTSTQLSSFGQDSSGELYVVDLSGNIFKIKAQ